MDSIIQNRRFACLQRNAAYEKVLTFLKQFHLNNPCNTSEECREISDLNAILKLLDTCIRFSKDAIWGIDREQIQHYRENQNYGVLQEEIFFIKYLNEIKNSIEYERCRLETDLELDGYIADLDKLRTPGQERGYVEDIQEYTTQLKDINLDYFEKIAQVGTPIDSRYKLGRILFSVIKENPKKLYEEM
ncbi:MAG: hypothetical protein OCD01_06155 [Fibrobacterales bacterium]